MKKAKYVFFLLLFLGVSSMIFSQEKREEIKVRGMIPEDYYSFLFASDPQISPNGQWVAFVVSKVSEDRRSRESSIWLVPTSGTAEPIRFTHGPSDSSPRWSPDGKHIAFLSNRGKKTQVYLISSQGGEAFPLTEVEEGVSSFQWYPDGSRMLLMLRTEEKMTKNPEGEKKEPRPDIQVIERARYKANGVHPYLDEKRTHIFVFDIASKKISQITKGEDWNDSDPVWSPDGKWIAFSSDRTGEEYEGSSNNDVWIIPADGGELKQLTTQPHQDTYPQWSPDGKTIAYLRTDKPYAQPEICLVSPLGGEHKCITEKVDRIPSGFKWAPDGRNIYYITNDLGQDPLFRLDVKTGEAQKLTQEPVSLRSLSISKDGSVLAFMLEDELRMPEVWVSDVSRKKVKQLSHFNTAFLKTLALQKVEEYWFTNDANQQVQGFLIRPMDWQPGKKYPLILYIHGGPSGMWGHSWSHEFQMIAAKGYAVYFVNFRGSTGYGHEFQRAVNFDYGGVDYRDNMQGLDDLLKRVDWIDANRLGVTGGSHGGFLTNWIITQTDRFKAAVTHRSISDWISAFGEQDFTPREMQIEFNGTPWDNYQLYWDRSPIKYANRIKTPTLIIHSDQDYRCPLGQAQELFYALKLHNIPTEMVIFQGENHNLSRTGKPVNLVEAIKILLNWFDIYLRT